jgi:hypothetical protein
MRFLIFSFFFLIFLFHEASKLESGIWMALWSHITTPNAFLVSNTSPWMRWMGVCLDPLRDWETKCSVTAFRYSRKLLKKQVHSSQNKYVGSILH